MNCKNTGEGAWVGAPLRNKVVRVQDIKCETTTSNHTELSQPRPSIMTCRQPVSNNSRKRDNAKHVKAALAPFELVEVPAENRCVVDLVGNRRPILTSVHATAS